MRGFGPLSESVMMDKCLREVTRDASKVFKFINLETDDRKRDAMVTLWHSLKLYVDEWDGADEEMRSDRRYARHTVHVWEMMLKQENGRKLLLVCIGGVVSGPNCRYYGYWGTCRGVSTAQMTAMEVFLEEMKLKANAPTPIDSFDLVAGHLSEDDDDDEGPLGGGEPDTGPKAPDGATGGDLSLIHI